jgi:hypothetical protein
MDGVDCFLLGDNDHAKSSWVLFEVVRPLPGRPRSPALPPAMAAFFGPRPDGEMRMRPHFQPACCPACGRYDEDDVFDIGFEGPVTIRLLGDFGWTEDRLCVVSARFLKVLRGAKVRGYETKPVGTSGWHALRVTERVECRKGVIRPSRKRCRACGRPDGGVGGFQDVGDLSVPGHPNTLFTTEVHRHRRFQDRDIFATDDVVGALKRAGIKGGYCNRLWTDEERDRIDEEAKVGVRWKPPGTTVLLNGR